jgi:hypothetical protein
MKPGGADETNRERTNSPFRQLHMSGHDLNHTYKVPAPSILGKGKGANESYMHPHDMGKGTGGGTEAAPQALRVANAVKPMSQQGAGKSGPPKLT